MQKTPVLVIFFLLSVFESIGYKFPIAAQILDIINIFLRPIAGAFIFYSLVQGSEETHSVLVLALSTTISLCIFLFNLIKAILRAFISYVTFGVGATGLSLIEDILSLVLTLIALLIPPLILLMIIFLLFFMTNKVIFRYKKESVKSNFNPAYRARNPLKATPPYRYTGLETNDQAKLRVSFPPPPTRYTGPKTLPKRNQSSSMKNKKNNP